MYNITQGNAGFVTTGSGQIQVTNHIFLDGQLIDTRIDTKIDRNNDRLVDMVNAQRG
jgi:hypothetical protein